MATPNLISLLSILYKYIIKIKKLLYSILEASNYYFGTYYLHYKEKLEIIKNIYNPYLFNRSNQLWIIKIQINDILMLDDNVFTSNKREIIKVIKIITKKYNMFLAIGHNTNSCNSKNITKTKLSSKE